MSRYAAFISYSHSDVATARWLHRALERYRLPKALVGGDTPFGPAPRRLQPVFRDRDELPASGDLGGELRAALAESRFQIVLCSPRAARSNWVNEEILSFKRVHGEGRTLALIVDGEPFAGDDRECFPPALRLKLAPDGGLSDVPAEPIAADIRPGKDGRRLALLKLIAGLSGLRLDALVRRDATRRQRRMAAITAASLAVALLTIGLAIYAEGQRRAAERQRRVADKSLEFLIGTFQLANPATENPRTITALTMLERVSERAATELKDEPAVSARLLQTTGEIYFNLGLPKESERDLRTALALEPERSELRARILLRLAIVAYQRKDLQASRELVDAAANAYDPSASYAPEIAAFVAERRGMVDMLAGNYTATIAGLGRAGAAYQALPGDHRRELGRVWISQALALQHLERYRQADVLLARAAATYAAKFGADNVLTATAIHNQALGDFKGKRYADAERRIGRALAVYVRVLDADHPTRAAALVLLGRIRAAQGNLRAALAAFDAARGIDVRLYGPLNASVGSVDYFAAEAVAASGDADAALRLLARTKLAYDASYGPDHVDQAELLLAKARVLAGAGRGAEAARDCAAALALKTKLDRDDPNIPENRRACADLGNGKPSM